MVTSTTRDLTAQRGKQGVRFGGSFLDRGERKPGWAGPVKRCFRLNCADVACECDISTIIYYRFSLGRWVKYFIILGLWKYGGKLVLDKHYVLVYYASNTLGH